jgi:hypothetical protein
MTDPALLGRLRILEGKLDRLTDALIELQGGTEAINRLATAVERLTAAVEEQTEITEQAERRHA